MVSPVGIYQMYSQGTCCFTLSIKISPETLDILYTPYTPNFTLADVTISCHASDLFKHPAFQYFSCLKVKCIPLFSL